ncbi:MAG: thioredoxin family protein [Gammaproteobacteria bacterium]|nr:thioredoxin family protein [Gammaproteobacteria bacterium]MCW9055134.1 thioredoxin family protein [Gammaproteobacteria bacterium]
MKPSIFSTDLANFDEMVIQASNDRPILVDLWADWCSPCIVIAPILKKAIEEFDNQVYLAKIEVDDGENMKIAGHYKVRGFPTVILFQYGKEIARFSGAKPLQFIRQFIEENADL